MTETQSKTETVTDMTDDTGEVAEPEGYVSPEIAAAQAGQVVVFELTPEEPEPEAEPEETNVHEQHEGH
jgi:hypothetical protein